MTPTLWLCLGWAVVATLAAFKYRQSRNAWKAKAQHWFDQAREQEADAAFWCSEAKWLRAQAPAVFDEDAEYPPVKLSPAACARIMGAVFPESKWAAARSPSEGET